MRALHEHIRHGKSPKRIAAYTKVEGAMATGNRHSGGWPQGFGLLCCACIILSSCITVQSASFYRAVWKASPDLKTILLYKDTEEVPPERIAQARYSFEYNLAEKLTLSDGLKKRWEYSVEKLSAWLLKTDQRKAAVPIPAYYREFAIEKIIVRGYPCYFMSPLNAQTKGKAIFYFHGGGFIYEMHPMHWDFAAQIVRKTGLPICIPIYPQIKPFVERVRSQGKYIEFYTGY